LMTRALDRLKQKENLKRENHLFSVAQI
jgi:hypothetical protein